MEKATLMRKPIAAMVVCGVLISLLSACCGSGLVKPDAPGKVEIADVVAAIQDAIDPFWQPKAGLPPLGTVKVALQTVHDTKFSGEADYLIVALKGYYDHAFTQELDLVLVPPPRGLSEEGLPQGITKALHDAIESAQRQIKATYTHNGHTLNTQEIDVQIAFAVTWDASAALKFSILPVTLNAGAETSLKTTNTVTVTFKKPSP
jgi:hypothetical protein